MRALCLLAASAVFIAQPAPQAGAANLLANPGFESPVSSADWTLTGGATREKPYSVGFSYALVMREEFVPQNTWASGFQTLSAAPGQTYTFSSQVIQSFLLQPDDYGLLEIVFLTASGQTAGAFQSAHLGLDNLPQDRTWANVRITGVAPPGTAQVSFRASFFHGCSEYTARIGFDNFVAEVQPVPEPYVAWCAAAVPIIAAVVSLKRKHRQT